MDILHNNIKEQKEEVYLYCQIKLRGLTTDYDYKDYEVSREFYIRKDYDVSLFALACL